MNFSTDKFAVVGLGDTGVSIIKYLRFEKANIVKVFDTRVNPPHQEILGSTPLHLGQLNYTDFTNIDVIVISPGVSIYEKALQLALRNGKQVVGDIELFALATRHWQSKFIGITGSNGKTTVTSLTGYLTEKVGLRTLVAGNIGTPVLESYIQIASGAQIPEVIVLELSSFQLETTYSLKLDVATVLNISEDHLDRYRDLLEYAYCKAHIFNHCKTQVLNSDDILVMAMQRQEMGIKYFGSSSAFSVVRKDDTSYLSVDGELYLACNELQLVGRHNFYNVLASLALLKSIDIDITSQAIKKGLCTFQGLEHRMQKVTVHKGIAFIEDSKGTNVGAVVAGVSGLDGAVHLILGGDGKGQDFSPLRDLVMQKCKSVAIIGQDKLAIAKILDGVVVPYQLFATLEEAVAYSISKAVSGEYVVLSPACASWDMFDNYKHRAKVFVDSVYANIN